MRVRPLTGAAATLVMAALLATSGCGGDEKPTLKLGGSSRTPTASASAPAPTLPQLPAATDDEAGRRAFTTWFVHALAYSDGTNDGTPITDKAIQDPKLTCTVCAAYTKHLADREAEGLTLTPSSYDVKRLFRTGADRGVVVYDVIASAPASKDVRTDGTVAERYPAYPNQLIEVGIRFRDGAYEISGWKVGKGGQG